MSFWGQNLTMYEKLLRNKLTISTVRPRGGTNNGK